jgi:CRP/FNR family cyclic AMP-dependent transcriptional regulator
MSASSNQPMSPQLIAQLAARGSQRSFERGDLLFSEGERSDSLYVLLEGELKVFTRNESGRELVYNVIQPGDFIGELILDGGPRLVSVRALRPSTCVVVQAEALRDLLRACPEFAECLVLKLIRRVRQTTDQLRSLAMKDVYERVVALLDEVAVGEGALRILDKSLTQQEIADRVGASREMVNQVFRELSRGGFIIRVADRGIAIAGDLPRHW